MKTERFDKKLFKQEVLNNLKTQFRVEIDNASQQQIYQAVAYALKEWIIEDWMDTQKTYEEKDPKILYYMSMEFLMGRALGNNLINMSMYGEVKEALDELGVDLNAVEDQEPDPALGNGGLGRLAACFLDSLATLGYAAYGCGIRYQYGMFKQKIKDGYQVEVPDEWLKNGNPFELKRPEYAKEVRFGGNIRTEYDEATGRTNFIQENYQSVMAVPFDYPIVGYGNHIVNTLRIWDAEPITDFQLDSFDKGEYDKAVEQKNLAKNIVEVLYPNDNHYEGKELRLKQQYFFVSASLQAAVAKYKKNHDDITKLYEKMTIQMNDTHPTVSVAELMRILMDEEGLGWDEAWEVTTKTCAYTNHTIMAEALEKWPIDLFSKLLPRVYQIVEEIDRRFVNKIREMYPGNEEKVKKMAILWDGQVRMAHMAIAAGYSVNGVAKLHTEILKDQELKDFYQMMPEKFNNKTNGVTQRRWLLFANPELSDFITKRIGHGWEKELSLLKGLEKYVDDDASLEELIAIKRHNKEKLAEYLKHSQNEFLDPESIFDTQVKRLHEYKRQLLNVFHIMYLYNKIVEDPSYNPPARTFIFGAKAASGYRRAKAIIKLINTVAERVNNDRRVRGKLRVVFVENYRVSVAEKIIPASDVSEQISTAGFEASGTSNMKFMMNGALTIGTLDGANIEIVEEAGEDNAFIFGLKADEIVKMKQEHSYNPTKYLDRNPSLAKVVNQLVDGTYDPSGLLFKELHDSIVYGVEGQQPDVYFILADFDSYVKAHEKLAAEYADKKAWARKTLINIANSGKFSSDRTIEDYVKDIWHLKKVTVK